MKEDLRRVRMTLRSCFASASFVTIHHDNVVSFAVLIVCCIFVLFTLFMTGFYIVAYFHLNTLACLWISNVFCWGLAVLVITDGTPDSAPKVEEVIINATKRMRQDADLSISFIQVFLHECVSGVGFL
jgi:hypothetical protein